MVVRLRNERFRDRDRLGLRGFQRAFYLSDRAFTSDSWASVLLGATL